MKHTGAIPHWSAVNRHTIPPARIYSDYWARSLQQAASTGKSGSIARLDAINAVIDKMWSLGLCAPRMLEVDR